MQCKSYVPLWQGICGCICGYSNPSTLLPDDFPDLRWMKSLEVLTAALHGLLNKEEVLESPHIEVSP